MKVTMEKIPQKVVIDSGNSGFVLVVRESKTNDIRGKMIVNKTTVEWRKGQARNGKKIEWNDLIAYLEGRK